MAFVKVNGINIYYELQGEGEPVIFLSGFSTHHETWRNFSDRLSKSHQTLIFDNRGAGQTDAPPPPYSIAMMAEDTNALMDILGLKQAYMIGSSMGTAIIQTLAFRYPQKIKKAILISPFAQLPRTSVMKSETIAKLLEASVPLPLVIESVIPWLYSSAFLDDPGRIRLKSDEMINNPYPQKLEGYLGQLSALQTFDLRNQIEEIQTEILLIAGDQDLSTPPYCSRLLHEKLPSSTLKTLPDVGHMVHVEKRNQVFELIHDFIQN